MLKRLMHALINLINKKCENNMKVFSIINNFITNNLFPRHIKCIACKNELSTKNVYDMCDDCFSKLDYISFHFCERCGLKFDKDGSGICLNCKRTNYYFEQARAVATFSGNLIKIIHRFKYAKYKFLAKPLAYFLHDTLLRQDWKIDLIAYVPLFLKREKDRGYNQSRELALHLSELASIPIFHDIVRLKDTPTQTKLSRKERMENVKNCFKINNKKSVQDLNILLLDDVFTTGSTTNEISKKLKDAGANKVYVLTVAHGGFNQYI